MVGLKCGRGGVPSLVHHTVFALYRHYPRMPPADMPSALAVLLLAAGISSPGSFIPRMVTIDLGDETLPVSKINSTSQFDGFALLSPFDLLFFVFFTSRCDTPILTYLYFNTTPTLRF